MPPDDLPDSKPRHPAVPDPTSTHLNAPRRGRTLNYPSLEEILGEERPKPTPPPASPRRWDPQSGRWLDPDPAAPSDPSLVDIDSRIPEATQGRFGFPEDLSDLPPETEEVPIAAAGPDGASRGWFQRLLGWLRGR